MSHHIILPNFNLSLLQSQKLLPQIKLSSDSIIVSTEIASSQQQNVFEIKFVVDSPFGQLQLSQKINIQNNQLAQILPQSVPEISIKANKEQFIGSPDLKQKSSQYHEIVNDEGRETAHSISATTFQDFEEERILKNSPCISTSSISAADEDEDTVDEGTHMSESFMKSEKKNSVKNILKAFGNFMQNLTNEDEILDLLSSSQDETQFSSLDDVKKRYQRYNKSKSYNNSLVCKIIQHNHYGILFKLFITKYASAWLESSEVGDKQSHETFINFCKNACDDHNYLGCLKIIKKKHLKLSSS